MDIASLLLRAAVAHIPQTVMIPLCFGVAWWLVAVLVRSIASFTQEGVSRVRTLHQIPCADCAFFTGDYHLKCPVRPSEALSEAAINCPDFQPKTTPLA
ncbi:hypothetical protein [Limnothrix redekei]|uniref:Uncharacterized protein n=1 Tax=Limnothrix redekei LRLZ20PSL1 TaxID=3112953 RepID=A0ABW7C9T4_9CYAN